MMQVLFHGNICQASFNQVTSLKKYFQQIQCLVIATHWVARPAIKKEKAKSKRKGELLAACHLRKTTIGWHQWNHLEL